MEYGKQIQMRVEDVRRELRAVPQHSEDPAWLLRYLEVESALDRLHASVYNSGMIDGAFLANLDAGLSEARAKIRALR